MLGPSAGQEVIYELVFPNLSGDSTQAAGQTERLRIAVPVYRCPLDTSVMTQGEETKTPQGVVTLTNADSGDGSLSSRNDAGAVVDNRSSNVPWTLKVLAVILVSSIGFGSHWSSGVTGAMKATLKKASNINFPSRIGNRGLAS